MKPTVRVRAALVAVAIAGVVAVVALRGPQGAPAPDASPADSESDAPPVASPQRVAAPTPNASDAPVPILAAGPPRGSARVEPVPPKLFRTLPARVVRKDTREPIAGAVVTAGEDGAPARFTATREGVTADPSSVGAVSDSQGRVRVPLGDYAKSATVRADHPGFLSWTGESEEVVEGRESSELEIPMEPGGAIQVEFTGVEPNLPPQGRLIVGGVKPQRIVTLQGAQTFVLGGVSEGVVTLDVEDLRTDPEPTGGWVRPRTAKFGVVLGETRRVTVPLHRGVELRVRVTRAGAPLRLDVVSVWSFESSILRSSDPDADGVHSFRGVPSGKVEVRGHVPFGSDAVVEVTLAENAAATVDLVVPIAGIRGTVRLAGVGPAPGLSMWLRSGAHGDSHFARTGADGAYAITDLSPGAYQLVAGDRSDDGDSETSVRSVSAQTKEVTVVEGRVSDLDFELRPAGAVTVRVVDAADRPVPQAVVTAVLAGSRTSVESRWNDFFIRGGVTGTRGTIRLTGLDAGRYVMFLDQSEYGDIASEAVDVAAGTESAAVVRVGRPARSRLLVKFESRSGRLALAFGHLWTAEGRTVPIALPHAGGLDLLALVEPGDYRLTVNDDDWDPVEQMIHVAGPSPQTVRVVLDPRKK